MITQRKVQCWIFSRGAAGDPSCLVLKTNVKRGGHWQPVTGSVEDHEGYFEAACREPAEETGFSFDAPPSDTGFEFDFTSRFGHAHERVFALYVEGQPEPRLDPKEHEGSQWTSPATALQMLKFPSNISGLKAAYRLVFGKELE